MVGEKIQSVPLLNEKELRVAFALEQKRTIGYAQATEYARTALDQLSVAKSTAPAIVSVSTVVRPSGVASKSGTEVVDTALYVFNFGTNEGFAIVSGLTGSEGLLACVGEGAFAVGDTVTNPGLAVFLSRIEPYQQAKEEELRHLIDSLGDEVSAKLAQFGAVSKKPMPPSLEIDDPNYEPPYWVTLLGSHIDQQVVLSAPVKWNQSGYEGSIDVYNRFTPNNYLAGCVPVAAAQLMAYHKRPWSIDGYGFNWTEMTRYTDANRLAQPYQDQVSKLLQTVGAYLQVDYGSEGSGANSDDVLGMLHTYGYTTPYGLISYDLNTTRASLNAGRPVYARGYAGEQVINWVLWVDLIHSEGHAWLIDGYHRKRNDYATYYREPDPLSPNGQCITYHSSYEYFVRCNWGWGSSNDGYYLSGVFNPTVYNKDKQQEEKVYYKYKIQIIPEIHVQ